MLTNTTPLWGLPDPETDHVFYEGVPRRRLVAWIIDTLIVTGLVVLAVPLTAFVGLFFFPLLWLAVSFAYRTATLARGGATWGMRFVGIELRAGDGQRPDAALAALHAGGYLAMTMIFPLQLVSMLMILITDRKQGLHDMVLGTAMINRPD